MPATIVRNPLQIYLGGPMVFDPDPQTIFERMKTLCHAQGVQGVAPLDNQVGLEGVLPGRDLLERIVQADIALMHRLDAGVFCLDGFRRAPEMDAGTAFEIGYMKALGKPIAGWTRDPRPYPAKVENFFTTTFNQPMTKAQPGSTGGTSGLLRDPDGILVHSETCLQNAMVHIGIELAGGAVTADTNWEAAFSAAITSIVRQHRS